MVREGRSKTIVTNRQSATDIPRLRVFALRKTKPAGYTLIDVSGILGTCAPSPVTVRTPRGNYVASCVENAWQYSKVYNVDLQGRRLVDERGEPNDAYYEWARAGWANLCAVRNPMGTQPRQNGTPFCIGTPRQIGVPICLYCLGPNGEHLSLYEARRQLFAPWYAKSVEHTADFHCLQHKYVAGVRIGLVDHDGWDHIAQGLTYDEVMRSNRKMSHAFVLAGLLEDNRYWLAQADANRYTYLPGRVGNGSRVSSRRTGNVNPTAR